MFAASGKTRKPGRRSAAVGLALAAAGLLFVPAPAQAATTLFTNTTAGVCTAAVLCLQAGSFGALVGLYNVDGTHQWTSSSVSYSVGTTGADINGEIGVGLGSSLSFANSTSTSKTWDGPIDFANTVSGGGTAGPCTGTGCAVASGSSLKGSGTGKITLTNGTHQDTTNTILTALTQIEALSDYYAAITGTTIAAGKLGATGTGSVTSIGGSGLKVYTTASIATNTTLTITGNATSLIVINVTGTASFGANISLSGIGSDQVFWNFTGINGTSSDTNYILTLNSGTVYGTFYANHDSYNAAGGTLNGRLFGGTGTEKWGTSFILNAPPDVTPEPSTYVLLGCGLGLLAWLRQKRSVARS